MRIRYFPHIGKTSSRFLWGNLNAIKYTSVAAGDPELTFGSSGKTRGHVTRAWTQPLEFWKTSCSD